MKRLLLSATCILFGASVYSQSQVWNLTGHAQGISMINSGAVAGTYINFVDHDGKTANIASFDNYNGAEFGNSLTFFARNGKKMRFATSADGSAGTNKLVILNNGNMGIGTGELAEATLHVGGDGIRGKRFSLGMINDLINDAPSYGLGFSNVKLSGSTVNAVQVSGFYGLLFKTAGGTIAMDGSGNVGIGTDSPDELLTVAGKVHCKGVKVTVDAGSDFVFEEDYNLPKLTDVERFVKENKHLPEVPTACEMEDEGYDMGAFQVKLLQKIEELTLYTIAQQKRIEELEKKVGQ